MRNDQEPDPKNPKAPSEMAQEVSDTGGKRLEERTAEEQLAAYEESLKEDDWGHQPC
jgi:hypothetical protein